MADKPGFFARRAFAKAAAREGIDMSKRKKRDIYLPSEKEMAAKEGVRRLFRATKAGAKQTVSRALSRKQ